MTNENDVANKIAKGCEYIYDNEKFRKIIKYLGNISTSLEDIASSEIAPPDDPTSCKIDDLMKYIYGANASIADYIDLDQHLQLLEVSEIIEYKYHSPRKYALSDIGVECFKISDMLDDELVSDYKNPQYLIQKIHQSFADIAKNI